MFVGHTQWCSGFSRGSALWHQSTETTKGPGYIGCINQVWVGVEEEENTRNFKLQMAIRVAVHEEELPVFVNMPICYAGRTCPPQESRAT